MLSHVQLSVAPWIVARQAPLPMEFSGQEYWSGLPFPTPIYKYTHIHIFSDVWKFNVSISNIWKTLIEILVRKEKISTI